MTSLADKKDLKIGLAGAGTMGRGIAQIAAQAGITVKVFDAREGAVEAARESIAAVLRKQVEKGRMDASAMDRTMANIQPVASLEAMADCDIAVEAIIEKFELKCELFRALEDILPEHAILATNTSSLSVTGMAAACRHPGRVAGLHFFNPVPLMKIVEVINGALTEPEVTQTLLKLCERMGHAAVQSRDLPGFIVNHAGRAFGPEGFRILSEGIAEFHTIDRIMREAGGFRMGPFELFDLIGLDVSQLVMNSIYDQFFQEQRFRPTALVAQRVSAGLLGRKSKRGFYDYSSGAPAPVPEQACPPVGKLPVWVSNAEPDAAEQLRTALEQDGVTVVRGERAPDDAILMVTPFGTDTSTTCVAQGLDPARTVAVDMLFPLTRRRTLMCSPATAAQYRDAAHGALGAGGIPVSVIRDSPGFIAQRIVAQIVSISCDIAQQRIASPRDIDTAVRIALNYPDGPLSMGDALGARRILGILDGLYSFYGDPRYRPSAWLKRRAALGLSLLTDD